MRIASDTLLLFLVVSRSKANHLIPILYKVLFPSLTTMTILVVPNCHSNPSLQGIWFFLSLSLPLEQQEAPFSSILCNLTQ